MSQFIRWYDNLLDGAVCKDIVQRFDADPDKKTGMVSGNQGPELDTAGKQTTELVIAPERWGDVIETLQDSLKAGLAQYTADVKFLAGSHHSALQFEPFRIKKYDIGGQFSWHIDCNSAQNYSRCLAIQWYFNDVEDGGCTEFEDQDVAVACVEGRMAFFPVAWTYRHRGAPPKSGPKYVCTTFVHARFNQ